MTTETLKLRPYARLLTMLGDQLIKNERIALVELIKNAYDADADRVEVRFEDFKPDLTHAADSRIVVRDNGAGMTPDVVRNEWMNPAAPTKYLTKRAGRRKTPGKGRVVQGEKGIGRFAILKLGKVVTVTTRPRSADMETRLTYDFARFDDDFVSENDEQKDIFLDEIGIEFSQAAPTLLPDAQHGTVIEIRELKGAWNDRVIEDLYRDVSNLTDPVSRLTHKERPDRFEIVVFCNGKLGSVDDDQAESLKALIDDKAVLKINGRFRSSENMFSFDLNDTVEEVNLKDSKVTGLWGMAGTLRQKAPHRSGPANVDAFPVRKPRRQKGSRGRREHRVRLRRLRVPFLRLRFFPRHRGPPRAEPEEKDRLKEHRIYLYRDGVRVYPYGDRDDDWLKIDVTRGIGRAGDFFSNDQIVGWIDITQEGNPNLRDKTNREGLIETGGAAGDLIFLVQLLLSYVKQHPYARYYYKKQKRKESRFLDDAVVARSLADLKSTFEEVGQKSQVQAVAKIESAYQREKEYLSQRAEDSRGSGWRRAVRGDGLPRHHASVEPGVANRRAARQDGADSGERRDPAAGGHAGRCLAADRGRDGGRADPVQIVPAAAKGAEDRAGARQDPQDLRDPA